VRRKNYSESNTDIWPGFVDALSTVLLVFIFVLVGFLSSQVYLSGLIIDKDSSLNSLQDRISTLCSLLDQEKSKSKNLETVNLELSKQIERLNETVTRLEDMFNKEKLKLNQEKLDKMSLKEKLAMLTQQMQDILLALEAEKTKVEEKEKDLSNLKKERAKLNDSLKFNTYRSEFFDKLQSIVKDKKGIKVVGDRFIFQSELFFDTASDVLSDEGISQVNELAQVVKEISSKIPKNVRWILRVDGHTDSRPITGKFASNWQLSAARSISVVKSLIKQGVAPEHLVAAGFGEHQPISNGKKEEDLAKNRRIEFKLDER
jgi:chemotaxis protein MotB